MMKVRIPILFLFLFFLCVWTPVRASIEIRTRNLTVSDGLANNSIRHIFQDSKGFIWCSTVNGLSRYDGNSFYTFQPDSERELVLNDHRIKNVMEDKDGFLWVSTASEKYSCYDLENGRFVEYGMTEGGKMHYTKTYLTSGGDVWLWHSDEGCRRVVHRQDRTLTSTVFDREGGMLPDNRVNFLYEDAGGRVWIGTRKGLAVVEGDGSVVADREQAFVSAQSYNNKVYFLTREGGVYVYREVEGVLEHCASLADGGRVTGKFPQGGKWVVLTTNGAYQYDFVTNRFSEEPRLKGMHNGEVITDNRGGIWVCNRTGYVRYLPSDGGEMKTIRLIPEEKLRFIEFERYYMVHDYRGIVWISTYGNGLFAYNTHTGEMEHFTAGNKNGGDLSSDFLMYVAEDRLGGIWVGTEYSGIFCVSVVSRSASRISLEAPDLYDRSNMVRMVARMPDGQIGVGTRRGKLYVYDAALKRRIDKQDFETNVYALGEDDKGQLWTGTRGGGLKIGNRWYRHRADDPEGLSYNHIFVIFRDSKQRMWVGTFGGGLDYAVAGKDGYKFRHFFTENPRQREIRTICEDRNGWFWVGTSEGIFVFHPDSLLQDPKAYYAYNVADGTLHSNEVKSIIQDRKGRMWIAESGAGFCVCTPDKDYAFLDPVHYTVNDGLASSIVEAFIEDDEGYIWMPTEYGLSRFDADRQQFNTYFFSNDLILGNVYTEGCAKLADGRLALGTNHGLLLVDPKNAEPEEKVPVITFTALRLNGAVVQPMDTDSPLEKSIAYAQEIELPYYQNSFVIDFSTFDYTIPSDTRFSYRLKGYDEDWSIPSALNFASYKNLPPGDYSLHVRAGNMTDMRNEGEAVLKIHITPPFWKTGWAIGVYVILILVAIYLVYRAIRDINNLRNQIKVEEQVTEYKLKFFTNISHEFRTPLSLIRGALERLHRTSDIPKDMMPSIKLMDKSTRRMLRLINQLLEFRRMQNGKLALSLEEADAIAFLHEIYLNFKDEAESKNMDFRFTAQESSCMMCFDKGSLDKIAYNLLSNAFKYTPIGGKIELAVIVDREAQRFILKVIDTGVGIPKEKYDELFKRFARSRLSGSSMGIGLHLTYELVNVHKGSITYDPNPEGGSIFTVSLPLGREVYDPKDFLNRENSPLMEEADPNHLIFGDKPVEEEAAAETLPEAPLNKRKVLVIEDDNDVRELLKQELMPYFEVAVQADGNGGLEYARNNDVDLIISDVMMPGYNGFELTRKLKNDFNTSHIPIVLLTALNAPENQLTGVESGADAYIPKPFSIRFLLTVIFKLIESRDKLRERFSNDLSAKRPVVCTSEKDKEFVESLTKIIEEQLSNPDFTAEDFGNQMGMGRTTFYRKVQGVTGYSPKEYLRVMRMKRAAELLLTKKYTVSEVTYQVGINDPFYFSRCFKQQFGISPSGYQKKCEEEQQKTPDGEKCMQNGEN